MATGVDSRGSFGAFAGHPGARRVFYRKMFSIIILCLRLPQMSCVSCALRGQAGFWRCQVVQIQCDNIK